MFKNRNGQVFVPDFVASVTLFAAILLFTGILWNSAVSNFSSDYDTDRQQNKYTLDLLTTPGSPSDWNETNVEIIGFSKNNSAKLDPQKFLEFKNITEINKIKLLRAQEYLLELRRLDGSVIEYKSEDLSFKSSTIPENQTVYSSRKPVVVKKGKVEIASELVYFTWG